MLVVFPGVFASADGHVLDALVFIVAALLAYRFPRSVPYVAVFAVGLQSTLTQALTSDGDALAGLAFGLGVLRARSNTVQWRPHTTGALWALAGLNLLVFLSFLANMRGSNGQQVTVGTEFFISRSALATAVVFLSDHDSDWQYRWGRAIGLLALALSIYRLSEAAGLPVKPMTDALRISVLGANGDPANANGFAVLAGVGIAFLLADAGHSTGRPHVREWVQWLAAAVVTVAMASAMSRTGVVIIALALVSLMVVAATRARRIAIVGLAGIFLVASLLPVFSIGNKPVVVSTAAAPDGTAATDQPPLVAPPATPPTSPRAVKVPTPVLPALQPQWRSVLDRSYYRLEATLPGPTVDRAGSYLVFVGRTGIDAVGVTLRIRVNGTLVAQLRPADMSPSYRWQQVPIPDGLFFSGSPLTVDFAATGNVDSAHNYFLIGGINARSSGYSGRIWTGESYVKADLSSDPGIQTGLLTVFIDGEIPPFNYFEAPRFVIDSSITDRLVLWQTALNVSLHNPVFGTGFYTFGLVRLQYQPSDSGLFYSYANAHSNYFQLLSDLGFAGPVLFLLVLLIPLVKLSRRIVSDGRTRDWLPLAMALALLAFLLSSVTQTWLADSRIYIVAWSVALVSTNAIATDRRTGHGVDDSGQR